MNWKEVKISSDNTHFIYEGKALFKKRYKSVLKYHEPGLAPVEDETGWYHVNTDGEAICKERYLRVFGYYFNRAAVTSKDGCFHVTETGVPAYEKKYAWVGNFQEGFCTVQSDIGSYFHIDINGKKIYDNSFLYAGDFKDGYACVKTVKGWLHIDAAGKPLNNKLFNGLGVFHKGYAAAKDDKGWFHINKEGNELYQERYALIEPFYNGRALVHGLFNNNRIIDETGKEVRSVR